MRVAIVGSREYLKLEEVARFMDRLPADTVIVSGGARGVDQEAARVGRFKGFEVVEFLPDYATHGSKAPLIRNRYIVDAADRVVAFWDGKSRGTMHTVAMARNVGKPVEVIE